MWGRRQWRRMMIIDERCDNEVLKTEGGTASQRLFCFVVVITEALHLFTQRSRLHQAGVWSIGRLWFVCFYAKHRAVVEKQCVSVCDVCSVSVLLFLLGLCLPPVWWLVCLVRICLILCIYFTFMYLLVLRVSRCFMWACVCMRTNLCMSVFESLLVPSGSSRVPDPISCRCWQGDIQARGSREPDTAWRSFLSLLRTTTWFVIVLMALCACVAFLAFVKLWFRLSGPRGQDLTVRERPRHEKGRPVVAVVMRSAGLCC